MNRNLFLNRRELFFFFVTKSDHFRIKHMIGQYYFPGDSPEWGDLAKGSSDKLKTRVVMCSRMEGLINTPVMTV